MQKSKYIFPQRASFIGSGHLVVTFALSVTCFLSFALSQNDRGYETFTMLNSIAYSNLWLLNPAAPALWEAIQHANEEKFEESTVILIVIFGSILATSVSFFVGWLVHVSIQRVNQGSRILVGGILAYLCLWILTATLGAWQCDREVLKVIEKIAKEQGFSGVERFEGVEELVRLEKENRKREGGNYGYYCKVFSPVPFRVEIEASGMHGPPDRISIFWIFGYLNGFPENNA